MAATLATKVTRDSYNSDKLMALLGATFNQLVDALIAGTLPKAETAVRIDGTSIRTAMVPAAHHYGETDRAVVVTSSSVSVIDAMRELIDARVVDGRCGVYQVYNPRPALTWRNLLRRPTLTIFLNY